MRSRLVPCSSFFVAILAASCAAEDQTSDDGGPDDVTADGGQGSDGGTGGSSGLPTTPDDEEPGTERCAEPPCANGEQCITSDDCVSRLCRQGICFPPGAGDGVQNGDETDVDCGGNPTAAPPCAAGKRCRTEPDCQSRVCTAQVCQAPTATDGVRNGDETDIDCGGTRAPACDDGKTCFQASDCASQVCDPTALRCLAPTASDGVQNGDETDIDCGGPVASACADTRRCVQGSDCASLSCQNQTCVAPTANDGIKNGNETDIDCGRAPAGVDTGAGPCAAGRSCLAATDCIEGYCPANGVEARVCVVPTANDGIKNGNESDVDCGNSGAGFDTQAPACATGQLCAAHGDCASNGCTELGAQAGRCAEAPSCTMIDGGRTCGAGEVGTNDENVVGANHESCCTSLPVPGFSDAAYPGKTVYLDKYEITAGRMRKFVERIAAANAGVPDVRGWLTQHLAANPGMRWESTADAARNWTRWLPANTGGRSPWNPAFPTSNPNDPGYAANMANWNANAVTLFTNPNAAANTSANRNYPTPTSSWAGEYGNTGTDYMFGVGGYYFYVHGHNCESASQGYPTYWYPNDVQGQVHNAGARGLSRANLDRRALNCAPLAMMAAFCAWDGGQLATSAVLASVTNVAWGNRDTGAAAVGRLPARASSNWTADAGAAPTLYNVPASAGEAARIAPPGRMVNDKVEYVVGGVSYGPWMDLRGNLQEAAIRENVSPLTFAGVHYDGIGRDSARGTRNAQAAYAEFKAGTVGGRCMRYR